MMHVVDELARVLSDRDQAVVVVKRAGFPPALIPAFDDPLVFWSRVVERACNGTLRDGLRPLLRAAAELYPSNQVFAAATAATTDSVQSLRTDVEQSFGLVRLLGARGHRYLSVKLEHLYVPPQLLPDPKGRRIVDGANQAEAEHELRADGIVPISLFDAFEWAQRCNRGAGLLLIGDPGSGKTTLLKYLALQAVRDDPLALGLSRDVLPLFVQLRDLDAGEPFASFVLRTLAERCRDAHAARSLLEQGRMLFLLDGLDEISRPEQRIEVLDWIDAMHRRSPGSRFVVSCRYPGHDQIPFDRATGLLDLHMCLLSTEGQSRLVYSWHLAIEASSSPGSQVEARAMHDAERMWAALQARCSEQPQLGALVRNPLLLTALCLAHRTRGTLPTSRVELLRECLDALCEPWRLVERTHWSMDPEHVWILLRAIALSLHVELRTDSAPPETLAEVMDAHLRAIGWESSPALAMALLRSLRDETGILVGKRGDRVGFVHAGLRELLCADACVAHAEHEAPAWRELALHFGDEWWQEVIRMIFAWPDGSTFEPIMRELVQLPAFGLYEDQLEACLAEATSFSAAPFLWLLEHASDDPASWRRQVVARNILRRRRMLESPPTSIAMPRTTTKVEERRGPRNGSYALVEIPAGSFRMGSRDDDHLAYATERPAHEVALSGFLLGRCPVTNAEYREFIRATEHPEPTLWADARFRGDDLPVVGVSWEDAMAYCRWAGLMLPTEAQWEHACRAGTNSRYWAGDEEADLERVAWYAGNSGGRIHPPGMKPANAFGLHDMHGNVMEWCLDGAADYRTKPRRGDGLRAGPDDTKGARGGSWKFSARGCRAAYRVKASVEYQGNVIGFRAALCLEP